MLSESGSPPPIRKLIDDACLATPGAKSNVHQVNDLEVPGKALAIPVRVYRPEGVGPHPVLLFFHGGGFVAGSLDTHDNACRYLCFHTSSLVVGVGYRLAPESRLPAQAEDCYSVTEWAAEHVGALGGDPLRLAVAGDSSGGTLAAAICHWARDRQGPRLRAQVLVNPALDLARWDGEAFAAYRIFRDLYLKDAQEVESLLAAPLRAPRVDGLPSALVIVGETDPLRAEGEAYAARLRAVGGVGEVFCQNGEGHLGPRFAAAAPEALAALERAARFLRSIWGDGQTAPQTL